MGAKLGKSKTVSISEKINEQESELPTTSNNHTNKTTTLEKILKKKEKFSNRKSTNTKVDKFTSTDGGFISSSSSIKHLVDRSGYNNHSYDGFNTQLSLSNQSETPSKDILELRDACIRRGIISSDMNTYILPSPNEINYQENIIEESTNEPFTKVIKDNEQEKQDES